MKQFKTLLLSALAIIMLFGCQDSANVEPRKEVNMGEALKLYIENLKSNGETNISEKINVFLTENYNVTATDGEEFSASNRRSNFISGPDECPYVPDFFQDADGVTWMIRQYSNCDGVNSGCVIGYIWTTGENGIGFYRAFRVC